jgi:hypothetical protein
MSRIVNGWRCNYRQVEDPIRPNAVAVDRRLERLSKALTPIRHRWAKSARKAPPLSAAAKLKAKTNKATKAKKQLRSCCAICVLRRDRSLRWMDAGERVWMRGARGRKNTCHHHAASTPA